MAVASPFQVGIGGQYDLPDLPGPKALHEGLNLQLVRADAVHGGDDAVQHVVEPLVGVGTLQCHGVQRLLNDANGGSVARGVAADGAGVNLGYVVAVGAEDYLLLDR